MDIKKIKTLVSILENSELSVLEITEGDVKILLKKPEMAVVTAVESVRPAVQKKESISEQKPVEETVDFNHITEIKSPLVGVYYSAPSPDSDSFVSVGSRVKKGDVLCIVEAMKVMNEITAEQDGEIVDILAKNGDIVEFGQTLFKLF